MKTNPPVDREEKFVFKSLGDNLKAFLIVVLITLIGFLASDARAAFSDNFDSLLADLQTLAPTLQANPDKTVQKQYKAVLKVIAAINKSSSSLETDVKTATKVAEDLEKIFPNDPTLANLVVGVFDGIESDTTDALNSLQLAAEALPAGTARTKALAALALAQSSLTAAEATSDPKSLNSLLGKTLKSIATGDKDLISKGGGGNSGGGGSGSKGQFFKANIPVPGEDFAAKIFSVTNAVNNPSEIVLSGVTSVVHSPTDFDFQQLSIAFVNFSGIGTYAGNDTPQTDFEFYFFHDTGTTDEQWDITIGGGNGTVNVTSYNSAAGTVAGNFQITLVNDATSDIMQIDGTFSLQGDELKGF